MAVEQKRPNTWAPRKRFRGKMVGPTGVPRSSSKVSKPSKVLYECGSTRVGAVQTKLLSGEYKVQMPRGRIKYVRGAS